MSKRGKVLISVLPIRERSKRGRRKGSEGHQSSKSVDLKN